MKRLYAGFLCAAILCITGCAKDDSPSISDIFLSWLELKSDVTNTKSASAIESRT